MNKKAFWHAVKNFKYVTILNIVLLIFFTNGLSYLLELYHTVGTTIFFLLIYMKYSIPEIKKIINNFFGAVYYYFDYLEDHKEVSELHKNTQGVNNGS